VESGGRPAGTPTRVFISYAHDSAEHEDAVRELWLLLRRYGVDATLDKPAAERRQDWPLWMLDQVRQADYVLVIASSAYRSRAEGLATADEARGIQFEAALIREELYKNREQNFGRFLPVVLPGHSVEEIPLFLGPTTGSIYRVAELTETGIGPLLRLLTEQPWWKAKRDFFISYTKLDQSWAEWIASELERAGYTTVIQAWDFRPGENFIVRMSETLQQAERLLAVLSPAYVGSAYAQDEWTASLIRDSSGRHRLVPVRVAETELPPLLASVVFIDLVDLNEEAARATLLAGVQRGRSRPEARISFPGRQASRRAVVPVAPEREPVRKFRPETSKGKVFISYSHKDRKLLQRLLVHLKPLERQGALSVWEDTQIKPGMLWQGEIRAALEAAHFAILLISADFLASEFIMNEELPQLLAVAESKGTIIMPLIVGPSRFRETESLSKFQSVNPPDAPLTKLSSYQRDELLVSGSWPAATPDG
jgi:TIR domain/SEFIR domain